MWMRQLQQQQLEGEPGPATLQCGFCHSKLTRTGEVLKLGAEALEYRDAPEESKKLRSKIEALEAEVARLKEELANKKSSDDDDDDDDF